MQPESPSKPNKFAFIKKRDLIIVGGLLLVAALALFVWQINKPPGAIAEVTVSLSGGKQEVTKIPLDKNGIYHIDNATLPITLEVNDGRIRFIDSVCHDHDCEGFGWLQREGEWAACLPARVWVRVVEPINP